ncbi:MAG: hypothetical protein HHAS10_10960 [Candidatus Altimarinota bacterium]
MNTKILVPAVLVTALTVAVAGTFAATGSNSSNGNSSVPGQISENGGERMGGHRGGPMGGPMNELSDAEKTSLESMTNTEKQAFFQKKRTEAEAKRSAHEAVIDKLLAGTALTTDEESLRQDIIKERAEMKTKRAEMEAKRTQFEAILEKQKAGTTLTQDEQKILDDMPKMQGPGGRGGHMKGETDTTSSAE